MSSPAEYISLLTGLGTRELFDGPMCSITCSGVMPRCKVMILALFCRVTSEKSFYSQWAQHRRKAPTQDGRCSQQTHGRAAQSQFHSPPDFFRCYSESVPRPSRRQLAPLAPPWHPATPSTVLRVLSCGPEWGGGRMKAWRSHSVRNVAARSRPARRPVHTAGAL